MPSKYLKATSPSLEVSAMGMWTVMKQRDHLIIFVDNLHMNSDGENYRMFNEPSGMFLLIQMLFLPVLIAVISLASHGVYLCMFLVCHAPFNLQAP